MHVIRKYKDVDSLYRALSNYMFSIIEIQSRMLFKLFI